MKRNTTNWMQAALIGVFVLAIGLALPSIFEAGLVRSADVHNVSTRVNITNAQPVVELVFIEANETPFNISDVYTNTTLRCNATILDYSDYNDIQHVNATFYHNSLATFTDSVDDNDYYFNNSCTTNSSIDAYRGTFLCTFDVTYFANNGSWNCTIQVTDYGNLMGNGTNSSNMSALYALNVTDLIDFRQLAVGDTSPGVQTNITNFGNQPLNISLWGFGRVYPAEENYSFVCNQGTNISLEYLHWSPNGSANTTDTWLTSKAIRNFSATIENRTINKQTVFGTSNYMTNATWWTLFVPPNPFGVCNGTVVFEAVGCDSGCILT